MLRRFSLKKEFHFTTCLLFNTIHLKNFLCDSSSTFNLLKECEIEIENWAYTREAVDLKLIRTTINLDNYSVSIKNTLLSAGGVGSH